MKPIHRNTSNDTKDVYKKGIDRKVNPRNLIYAKIVNRVADFKPIRIDNPTPISDVESNAKAMGEIERVFG